MPKYFVFSWEKEEGPKGGIADLKMMATGQDALHKVLAYLDKNAAEGRVIQVSSERGTTITGLCWPRTAHPAPLVPVDELDAIETRANAATVGPWYTGGARDSHFVRVENEMGRGLAQCSVGADQGALFFDSPYNDYFCLQR